MIERCSECKNELAPETTVTITDDFKVCQSCFYETNAEWESMKEMLREQGIDPDDCGWRDRLVA